MGETTMSVAAPRDWILLALLANLLGCRSTPTTRLDGALDAGIDAMFAGVHEDARTWERPWNCLRWHRRVRHRWCS
jgi:hypothetical protein